MIETPVSASPASIARSTGAAPRQRGSSDGWTFSIGHSDSSGSLMSAPKAQIRTASGSTAAIAVRASSEFTLAGWSSSMPSSRAASAAARRRRRDLPPAAARAVGPGDDQLRPVVALGEASQHGHGERRGAKVDGAHGDQRRPASGPGPKRFRAAVYVCSVPDPSIVRFRRAVATACAELDRRRQEVNDLNVFPVADGDTGDNMAMTMRAVLAELDRINGQMIDDIGRDELVAAVARAALLGARGNSGVILSQIVRGAAEELASRPGELIDPILVSAAFARAADAAYESVRNPAEGTMLSAVRAMAHRIAQDLAHMEPRRLAPGVPQEEQDKLLADVLERALDAGSEAVRRGPEQLDVLREAGVVDAGAYGLTVIIAGVISALKGDEDALQLEHHHAPSGGLHLPQHES